MPLCQRSPVRWEGPEQFHPLLPAGCPDIVGVGCPVGVFLDLFACALVDLAKLKLFHRDAVVDRTDINTEVTCHALGVIDLKSTVLVHPDRLMRGILAYD